MATDLERKDSIVAEFEALRVKPTCPFLDKIPTEIRIRIYKLLLLPSAAPRIECSAWAPDGRTCTPGGRLFSSTCKPKPSTLRAIGCTSCKHRGEDVDTAILRTNKKIFGEAVEVLYENVVAVHRIRNIATGTPATMHWAPDGIPAYGRQYIKRFHLAIESESRQAAVQTPGPVISWNEHIRRVCWVISNWLPTISVFSLHMDIDLTAYNYEQDFGILADLVNFDFDFVVDVHVLRTWSEVVLGWQEIVDSREGCEEMALKLDQWVMTIRAHLIGILEWKADQLGKKLMIRED